MPTPQPTQRVVLPATLLVVMTSGVFQFLVFAVLAAPLIDDVGMTRTELGILGSVNLLTGAVTAPLTGRVVDRLGPSRSVVACLGFAAASMAALAAAPNLAWMMAAAVVGGIPQGASNPATNSLISARVEPGRRGTLTGIKQSGVTMGAFVAGATMPALDAAVGWRGACAVYAAAFAAVAVAARVLLVADGASPGADATGGAAVPARGPLPSVVWSIAVYGFFMGTATGAVSRFLPLFAEESLGFSTHTAGLVVAASGLLGMVARIVAAHAAERRLAATRLLIGLSLVGAAFAVLLAVTTAATRHLIWLAPPLSAIGTNAWNAVAMLAIIMLVTQVQAGRASGVVMFGFLGGMATAGPVTGWVVDATGSYRPVWVGAVATSLIAAAVMLVTDTRRRRDSVASRQPTETGRFA